MSLIAQHIALRATDGNGSCPELNSLTQEGANDRYSLSRSFSCHLRRCCDRLRQQRIDLADSPLGGCRRSVRRRHPRTSQRSVSDERPARDIRHIPHARRLVDRREDHGHQHFDDDRRPGSIHAYGRAARKCAAGIQRSGDQREDRDLRGHRPGRDHHLGDVEREQRPRRFRASQWTRRPRQGSRPLRTGGQPEWNVPKPGVHRSRLEDHDNGEHGV